MKETQVEVERFDLSSTDANELSGLMDSLKDLKAQLGQAALNLHVVREQMAEVESKSAKEQETLRSQIAEKHSEIQVLSKKLMDSYQIDLSKGGWSLNVAEGAFIRTQSSAPAAEAATDTALSRVSSAAKKSSKKATKTVRSAAKRQKKK